jgi:hypothetical protein
MPLSPARVLRAFRHAMFFDGVDDYVLLPNIPFAGEVTLGAWFWDISILTNYWGTVFSWLYDINNYFILNHYATTGLQKWTVRFPGISFNILSSTTIPNRWVYATGVYSASQGFARLYWDSALQNSVTFTPFTQPALTPTSVQIGRFLTSYIAQVLLYSRALSESEIRFNYSNPDNPIRNGLVLWLRAHPDNIRDIDGDGVPEWLDLSGYGNHGKIYGARLVELIRTPVR